MEINRNQWFLIGLVLLMLGGQFLCVERAELKDEVTKFLAERTNHPMAGLSAATQTLTGTEGRLPTKTISPPQWIGYMIGSLGLVCVLHSLGMSKPAK